MNVRNNNLTALQVVARARQRAARITTIMLGLVVSLAAISSSISSRHAFSGPCAQAVPMDTAQLYQFALPRTSPGAPCEAYACGYGHEWWGVIALPPGSWRLKVKNADPVCVSLLSHCDSICQATTIQAGGVLDWKSSRPQRWTVFVSAGAPVSLAMEVGRYELGQECVPQYWGDPCDSGR